ncbi:GSCOCG00011867001-RA-CDS, partial [Cotesia congregata]
ITIQFIPLRNVLKEIFELPFIFNDSREYLQNLEENDVLIKNVVQSESWKKKKATLGEKLVFPIFMYQDDYETNNPLGSHKGLGKMGAVYIVMPCLPPHLSSKTENIFLLTLYKSNDLKYVSLQVILAEAIKELEFLESTGISISPTQIYFSLAGVIGDNLAAHTILGFIGSFSANFPCRFCKIHRSDINSTFKESSCELRSEEIYKVDLEKNELSETGIAGPSVFETHLKTASTIDLMTVDVMHDLLEGICEYD